MGGGKVPDAWDDDWIEKADSPASTTESTTKPAKLSKAERRAKQAEFNRQLWEDAEAPKDNFFLNTRADVPLKTEFKPAMKVLSRKPQAKPAPGADSTSGMGQLSIEDDDEDEEDDARNITLSAEERLLKTQREREEKQKKYEEARQRLFGKESALATINSGSTTPPKVKTSNEIKTHRGKGSRDPRPPSSAAGSRQLYDPNFSPKPDSLFIQNKDRTPNSSGRSTPNEQQPIRNPRGPDNSGRGGFGFTARGGKVT